MQTGKAVGKLPSGLKLENRRIVLDVLRHLDTFSVADVASQVALSRQTVMKVLDHFIETGLIISLGKGESTDIGGKKPELFRFDPPQRLLCILVHTDELMLRFTDLRANVLASWQAALHKDVTFEEMFGLIEEGYATLLAQNPGAGKALYGVSLCVPGIVEAKTGNLRYTPYWPEWGYDLPLEKRLREIFPGAEYVKVDNIGRMSGSSVLWPPRILPERKSGVVLYSNVGVSASFITKNGEVKTGANSLIGEVGHIILAPNDEEQCGCGSYGCFERLVELKRVRKVIAGLLPEYPDSVLHAVPLETLHFDHIFEGSREGDALCRLETERLAKLFAQMLRTILFATDPDYIIFQGNFAKADRHFDETLCKHLSGMRYFPQKSSTQILYEQRDLVELETIGSVQVIIRHFFNDLSLYEDD